MRSPHLSVARRHGGCPGWGGGSGQSNLGSVSTRMLIILALICGVAVVVAFAVQVLLVGG